MPWHGERLARIKATPQWQKNLYVMFVAEMVTIMGLSFISPILLLYVDQLDRGFGSTEFWTGIAFSGQSLTLALGGPVWGALADRFGRKVMVQRVMFGGALALALTGFVQSAEQLALIYTLQGTITGTVAAATTFVAASTPRTHTGYAIGFMQMGIWTGLSLGPLLGGIIADTFGFRPAFMLGSAGLFLAGLCVSLFVRETFVSSRTVGLSGRALLSDWLDLLRTNGLARIFSIRTLVRMGQAVARPYLPLFTALLLASQDGVSTVTGLAVGVAAATAAISSVYSGHMSDRIGPERLLLTSALCAATSYALMAAVTHGWQLVVLHGIIGAAIGGIMPAATTLVTHAVPEGRVGAVYGLDAGISSGGAMVAPLLGNACIALAGLRSMFVLVAMIFALVSYLTLSRRPAPRTQASEDDCVRASKPAMGD